MALSIVAIAVGAVENAEDIDIDSSGSRVSAAEGEGRACRGHYARFVHLGEELLAVLVVAWADESSWLWSPRMGALEKMLDAAISLSRRKRRCCAGRCHCGCSSSRSAFENLIADEFEE